MQDKKLGRKELRIFKDDIIYKYTKEKLSTYKIANFYNTYATTVRDILKENNIDTTIDNSYKRKYKLNEHFFDIIDTEEKAYVLGFLYADGCNSPSGRRVFIEINKKDIEILEKIKEIIGTDIPIRPGNKQYMRDKGKNTEDSVILDFNSKYMAIKLEELGVTQNKSLSLTFPDWLDEELKSHFIRGYYDGDGSVYKSGNGLGIKIVSSYYFIQYLYDYLSNKNYHCTIDDCKNKETQSLLISTQKDVRNFLEFIYKDATIYMERKYKRYHDFYKYGKLPENYKTNK